jgi:hypothetical protein
MLLGPPPLSNVKVRPKKLKLSPRAQAQAAGLFRPCRGGSCGTAQLGSQGPLEGDRLFPILHGDGGMGVIVRRGRIRDLAKEFLALDDVQAHAFTDGRENAEDHVVFGHDNPQRQGLILGRVNEMADVVCEASQFFKIDHTHTPRN